MTSSMFNFFVSALHEWTLKQHFPLAPRFECQSWSLPNNSDSLRIYLHVRKDKLNTIITVRLFIVFNFNTLIIITYGVNLKRLGKWKHGIILSRVSDKVSFRWTSFFHFLSVLFRKIKGVEVNNDVFFADRKSVV